MSTTGWGAAGGTSPGQCPCPATAALRDPARLADVERYSALLDGTDAGLGVIARLAAQLCATPAATLVLVGDERRHLVVGHGIRDERGAHGAPGGLRGTGGPDSGGPVLPPGPDPLDLAVLACGDLVVVPDAAADPRTAASWVLRADPPLRFAAVAPVRSSDGHVVGVLGVHDTVPRTLLDERKAGLCALADQAGQLLALRDGAARLAADMVRRELVETGLRENESRLQSLLDHSGAEVWVKDLDGTYLYANSAYLARRGWTRSAVEGRSDADLLPPGELVAARRLADEVVRATRPVVREHAEFGRDGRRRDYLTVHVPLGGEGGRPRAVAAMATDVTELRDARRELARSVLHDPLTGLPNRTLLRDRIERALTRAGRAGGGVAAVRVDLDGFGSLTVERGTAAGDAVLVEVSQRLRRVAGPTDSVARMSADEFVLVCEHPSGAAAVEAMAGALAARVASALRAPYSVGQDVVHLTASLGLAALVGRGSPAVEAEDLARDSAAALAQAKALGGDRTEAFDERLRSAAAGRSSAESGLRAALGSGTGIAVHYQPLVDLSDGRPVGVEALVRVSAPEGAPLPTDRVVAAAEASGLVVPLGVHVLRQACADVAGWRAALGVPLALTVNLSARQVARRDLVDVVVSALADTGLPARALGLELTETALIEAEPTAIRSLERLRQRGVAVGVDDFGTGYASLRYLRELPVSFLKVDGSFVRGLPGDPDDSAIVGAVIGLARALRLRCVAEGIETRGQLAALREHDGLLGQGYLLARPVAGDAVPDLLRRGGLLPPPEG